jgi:FkbH-like protein
VVIQNLFELAPWNALGHYAARHSAAPTHWLQRLNQRLSDAAPSHVTLHDLPALVLQAGSRDWFDPRYYHEAKLPCGPRSLVPYAHSVASLVTAILGRSRKVLVLDLDNTLWGGAIGDLGIEGIRIGQGSGEGEAFLAFQRYARALKERGILLAVCSKNDDANARQPFERHDDMVLRLDDFACFIANWQNKADNIRTIARTLDLGVDSLVFVDDNPAERAIVRRFAPEVAVPALPEDPAGYVQAVARHRYFETVSWTVEDAKRADYYAANSRRNQLKLETGDIDSFLASLGMAATIRPVSEVNIQRVTQLVNKSNQFNLTTRRRTLPEVEALSRDDDWFTVTISLADKLGDNGLISVLFLHRTGTVLEIDTWLMSCRVLQRGVEQLALNQVVGIARQAGCHEVHGTYMPTARNALVRDHYRDLGFTPRGEDGDTTHWTLAVDAFEPFPTFIEVTSTDVDDQTTTAGRVS